jgi:transposase-like protein
MKQRRTFSPEFKAQVVLEVLSGAKTQAEACREYQLEPELLSKGKAHLIGAQDKWTLTGSGGARSSSP